MLSYLLCIKTATIITVKIKGRFNPSWVISVASVHMFLYILQYSSLPLLCINTYKNEENYGSGEIQHLDTGVVHYLGTGPKGVVHLARALELSFTLCIPHSCNSKTDFNPHILLW